MSDIQAPSPGRSVADSDVHACGDEPEAQLRPPTRGRPVRLAGASRPVRGALFVVGYEGEDYAFAEGSWGRFGRDDLVCQIPIWEEVRGRRLSRIAGELWCVDGELWVRNLSSSHELVVHSGTGRPQMLPPREPTQRGPACSVPTPHASLSAPSTGEWRVAVRAVVAGDEASDQARVEGSGGSAAVNAAADAGSGAGGEGTSPSSTSRVGPVPDELREVAAALCAPMIESDAGPATYDGVAARLSITKRQARRYVERLCDHYRDQAVLHGQDPEPGRPFYAPIAELLVRRGRVTAADVASLRAPTPTADRR